MSKTLEAQYQALPEQLKATLTRYGFDLAQFLELASRVKAGKIEDNYVKGELQPPKPEDVQSLPAKDTPAYAELVALGEEELRAGRVALAVLAGGMATRMGGVVKALVEALPGKTFLDLRLQEIESNRQKYGKAPPLWLMASYSTEGPLRQALGARVDHDKIGLFTQFISLRVTPEGELFLDAQGKPSEHAKGHGDFPEALQRSGLLQRFVDGGGRVVMLTNLDNLGGTLDPAIIGWHVKHGQPVTMEVVDKLPSDRGGIPIYVDNVLSMLEEFRIPPSFDPATVRVFNTNVFHFDARALNELKMNWTYFQVNKKVDSKPVVQFERLVNEIAGKLPTRYLLVPREGVESRFLPVKDNEELVQRRAENEAVARARGMIA
ncbi:MAG TPA: UTP--glucose-1-phosphate uridylyltransferase [Polyangiaceae bacterium]|nr:UTP--glucose-1-phosphate uridylyltransferase [Polyangiaceae bacterium]